MSGSEKTFLFSVNLPVTLRVSATRDSEGMTEIRHVLDVVGLPTAREVREAMGDDDWTALDEAYDRAD